MSDRRTYATLLAGVRDNLDEQTAANWDANVMLRTISRAAHVVWTECRKLKHDYMLISRASTDGSVTIYGDSYATSGFALVAGTREYTLPGDLAEIKTIEVITSGSEWITFTHRDLAHPDMRAARQIPENLEASGFLFDIVGERTLTLAPKPAAALDLRLWYVPTTCIFSTAGASLMVFAASDDYLLLPHPMYLAVEEVATWRCQMQDRDPNAGAWIGVAAASVARFFGSSGRQSQDGDVVVGVFE